MSTTEPSPPAGFEAHQSPSNFMHGLGTMYKRDEVDGSTTIALRVAEAHLNLHGVGHGGFIATLIDNALGYNVAKATGGSVVTANLNIDYLAAAQRDAWVEARVQILRQGQRMVFAECRLTAGETLLARATSILAPARRS